jgi:uncharacterized membrane protein YeaQ/YmgE (transglycosylase-associated protein family)
MSILLLIVVGLVAGVLASRVAGGIGYGLVGDIAVGILGAFFGSWLFGAMGAGQVLPGILGTMFVAFIGAVVLLVIAHVIMSAARTGGRRHSHA